MGKRSREPQLWTPTLIGRLGRLIVGTISISSLQWIASDQYCVLYWFMFIIGLLLIQRMFAVIFDIPVSKLPRDPMGDKLPLFAAMSICLWAAIFDAFLWSFSELYLTYYAVSMVIMFALCAYGTANVLAGFFSISGSVFNAYAFIFNHKSFFDAGRTNTKFRMYPVREYCMTYWVNLIESKFSK